MRPFPSQCVSWRAASALVCALWLVACGGVDSGGTGAFASGPITGFGSIIVGNVHYDESAALVEDEFGVASDSARLRLGMFTEIRATAPEGDARMPTATAMSVRFRSEIVGRVSAIDTAAATLTVLGQTVKIGAKTAFDESLVGGLAALRVTDIVEVYGQYDAKARQYTATRIEPRADATLFKLRGRMTSLDEAAQTFVIGGQTIAYGAVTPLPALKSGQTIRVLLNKTSAGAAWTATAVEVGITQLPDRPTAEVEGRVTAFVSLSQFEVDGIAVLTSGTTQFPDGTAGIVLGAHVEIKGSLSGGNLIASKVSVDDDDDEETEPFEISGAITNLDTTAKTFVLNGSSGGRGITVSYANTVVFEGGNAADLARARRAEVRGTLSSDGTRLEARSIHMEI